MEENLLDDIEYRYQQARSGVRFSNFLIDRLILFGLWRLLLYFVAYPFILFLYSMHVNNRYVIFLLFYALGALVFLLYCTLFESATGGKTPGKFITRTRAVNSDGTRITVKTAFLRSLCRLIPFEAFSALGNPSYPWHDRFSKTLVVDEKLTQLPPWE
jgi:uncharacterized RDD family membrane protein YckC